MFRSPGLNSTLSVRLPVIFAYSKRGHEEVERHPEGQMESKQQTCVEQDQSKQWGIKSGVPSMHSTSFLCAAIERCDSDWAMLEVCVNLCCDKMSQHIYWAGTWIQ